MANKPHTLSEIPTFSVKSGAIGVQGSTNLPLYNVSISESLIYIGFRGDADIIFVIYSGD